MSSKQTTEFLAFLATDFWEAMDAGRNWEAFHAMKTWCQATGNEIGTFPPHGA